MEEIDVRECQKNNLVDESNYSFVMCKNSSGNYRTLCYFHFSLNNNSVGRIQELNERFPYDNTKRKVRSI